MPTSTLWSISFLDETGAKRFKLPWWSPKKASGRATGANSTKRGPNVLCWTHDLYLIPTAEVPVTNILYRDVLPLREDQLPIKMPVVIRPVFRREDHATPTSKVLNVYINLTKLKIVRMRTSWELIQSPMAWHVGTCGVAFGKSWNCLIGQVCVCGGDMDLLPDWPMTSRCIPMPKKMVGS